MDKYERTTKIISFINKSHELSYEERLILENKLLYADGIPATRFFDFLANFIDGLEAKKDLDV